MKASLSSHARRRASTFCAVATVAALSSAGLAVAAGTASADDEIPLIWASTSRGIASDGTGGITPFVTLPDTYGEGILVSNVIGPGSKIWLGKSDSPMWADDAWVWCLKIGGTNPGGSTIESETNAEDGRAAATALAGYDPSQVVETVRKHQNDDTWLSLEDAAKRNGALSYLVHTTFEVDEPSLGISPDTRIANLIAYTPQEIKDIANSLYADAEDTSGPYTGRAPVNPDPSPKMSGIIKGICQENGRGGCLPGITFDIEIVNPDGSPAPANVAGTGTNKYTGVTTSTEMTVSYVATGNAQNVIPKVTYRDVPRRTFTKFGASGAVQDTASLGNRGPWDPATITVPGQPFDLLFDFTPMATSKVQTVFLTPGQPWVDVFTTFAAPGEVWSPVNGSPVPVTYDLQVRPFGQIPTAEVPTVPNGVGTMYTTQFVSQGPQAAIPVTIPGTVVMTPQLATVTVSVAKASQPGTNGQYVRPWASAFGIEDETVSLRRVLKHSSETREGSSFPGGRFYDKQFTTGFPDDQGSFDGLGSWEADRETMIRRVRGPVAEQDLAIDPSTAPVLYQAETPAENTPGGYWLGLDPANPITFPACSLGSPYEWYFGTQEFLGDSRTEPMPESGATEPFQWVQVDCTTVAPVGPKMVSQATTSVPDGSIMTDRVMVWDLDPTKTWTLGWEQLYQPEGVALEDADVIAIVDPISIPAREGVYEHPTKADLAGMGLDPTIAADAHWIPVLYANGVEAKREAMDTASQVTRILPKVVIETQVRSVSKTPVVSDPIWDDWKVISGTPAEGDVAVIELYTWEMGTPPKCEGEPIATYRMPMSPMILSGSTDRYTTVLPLKHGYIERVEDEDGHAKSEWSECGLTSETITVNPTPEVPTPAPTSTDSGAGSASAGAGLAATGTDTGPLLVTAIVFAAAGLVVLVRKRFARS